MRIRSDEMDGFTRIYDGIRYLILFSSEKLDAIYNRVRNLIIQKRGTAYLFSHNYVKIKIDSYDSLPREKALTLDNVIFLIKSVFKVPEGIDAKKGISEMSVMFVTIGIF